MKTEKQKADGLIMLYSFTIPLLAVLMSFAFKGLTPFGGRSIISMDGFSQYYPAETGKITGEDAENAAPAHIDGRPDFC